jgi:predicted alpha/beta hydrolase family esterase
MPAGYPCLDELHEGGWLPVPRAPLPFPSVVLASRNDPLARFDRVQALARDWDSALEDLGEVGHLNPASGYGQWPSALPMVDRISARYTGA